METSPTSGASARSFGWTPGSPLAAPSAPVPGTAPSPTYGSSACTSDSGTAHSQRELDDPLRLPSDRDDIALAKRLRCGEHLAVDQRLVGRTGDGRDLPLSVGTALDHALPRVPVLGVAAELTRELL